MSCDHWWRTLYEIGYGWVSTCTDCGARESGEHSDECQFGMYRNHMPCICGAEEEFAAYEASRKKPLAIDLYCGLGGWAEGFLAEDYDVIGFDIERHDYGTGGYPGQLVLQDATTLHGSQFKDAAVIVASPPCQKYSYMAMPWKRAKEQIKSYEASEERRSELTLLFDTCFRLQREASEASGRYIPLIVENVRGAQRWVGRAKWHFGSYYLWGDVPALMPITLKAEKFNPDGTEHGPGSWFAVADSTNRGVRSGVKIGDSPGRRFDERPRGNVAAHREGAKCPNGKTHERTTGPGRPRFIEGRLHVSDAMRLPITGPNSVRGDSLALGDVPDSQSLPEIGGRLPGTYGSTEGLKVPGMNWSGSGNPDYKPKGFNVTAAQRYREGVKQAGISGERNNGKGDRWCQDGAAQHGSKSDSRRAASAQIAKIPFPLAQHIARCFKPAMLNSAHEASRTVRARVNGRTG